MSQHRTGPTATAASDKRMITIPVGGRPPKHGQAMQRQLVIRVPAQLLQRLEACAQANKWSLAEAARELLDRHLAQEGF